MTSKRLRIAGTGYSPMRVLNGEHHLARIRFRKRRHVPRDRGTVHAIVSRAAGYRGTRGLTEARAMRGDWHTVRIRRRALARRFMVEIEVLAAHGIVEIVLDGEVVRMASREE